MHVHRALIVCFAVLFAATARGQQASVVDWGQLPPSEFAASAESWLASDPPPSNEDRRQVTAIAWERFLDDRQFLAEGSWPDVSRIAALFGPLWPLLEEAPAQEPTPRVMAFRSALAARVSTLTAADDFASLAANDRAMSAAGLSRSELAPLAVNWMRGADWHALSFSDRISLADMLHAELVPRSRFAVRWSGSLAAAAAGEYVFEQILQHHVDGRMRVAIGGRVILDSAPATNAPAGSGGRSFVSEPIALEAGASAPIVVEYYYDADSMLTNREFLERICPMAVLAWRRGDQPPEPIPAEAFTSSDGRPGLRGEYFASLELDQPVGERLDPGVQMIWSKQQRGPDLVDEQILSAFDTEQQQVVKSCVDELLEGDALVRLSVEPSFYENDLPRLLQRMPARQRLAVIDELIRLPESLGATSPLGMRFILPHVYMLSPKLVGDYLATWVEAREVDANVIRKYPGWGADFFNRKTYDDYGWVGHFVRGANWPIAQRLLNEHLTREDGSCNLMVAYCVGMAWVFDRESEEMIARLEERLADPELTGDARATWLLARAFLEEVNVGGMPRPGRGLNYLEEASLVAESSEMQFRILQELVARYGSAGVTKRANGLLDGAEGRFPERSAEIAAWRQQLAAIGASALSSQR